MHLNSARSGLLLNVARTPCLTCDASTSAECFEASLPHLSRASRAPGTSEPSSSLISSTSLARGAHRHVMDLCASASHCCSAGTLGFDHACIRPRPSWTSGSNSRDSPGTYLTPSHPLSHAVEHLLGHLHPLLFRRSVTLGYFGTLHYLLFLFSTHLNVLPPRVSRGQQRSHPLRALRVEISTLVRLAVGYALLSWVLGSQPWLLLHGSPSPGCFSFFTSIRHVFHPPDPMISMPTSPSESRLSALASRENRNHHLQEHIPSSRHHLPRTTGMSTTLSLY